jgi:hypothetical protein
MFSKTRNFIFVHIPKTAGTSISEALAPYASVPDDVDPSQIRHWTRRWKHATIREYADVLEPEFLQRATKFCVVRNPWSRAISHYFYRTQRLVRISNGKMAGADEFSFDVESFRTFLNRVPPIRDFVSLARRSGEPRRISRHSMDRILRVETLQDDFDELASVIGIPSTILGRSNSSRHKPYSEYYTKEARDLVSERFAEEIEYFGYRFND